MSILVVTRHRGAVEWLARHFAEAFYPDRPVEIGITDDAITLESEGHSRSIPVKASVTEDDLGPTVGVYGNLPFHLASLCYVVVAIEFNGPPPRGAEYGVAEMEAAGARLREYVVVSEGQRGKLARHLENDGFCGGAMAALEGRF